MSWELQIKLVALFDYFAVFLIFEVLSIFQVD